MKLLIALTGASGTRLARRLLAALPPSIERHLIASRGALEVLAREEGVKLYDSKNLAAGPASGSFGIDAMIVTPCSMNTLAKIAVGIADTLPTRAASVMLKERRPLILAPREMPFSTIALEHMAKLSQMGVIIAPPVLGYYAGVRSLAQMESFIVGKWLDLLSIEHNLYQRWQG
ncbi:MAG: UbiX family flavin prenyltransferase [Campylobacterales bacterium]